MARGCRSFDGRREEDDFGSPVEGIVPPCEVHGASPVGGSERFVEAGARRDADDERVFRVNSSNRVRSSALGFSTRSIKKSPARPGRNPRTGERITIAASAVPAFKASKALRDAVR